MQVHHGIDALPAFSNTAITIGTFDGVHAGHRQIIDAVRQEARKRKGKAVVITFHPHPRKIVQPAKRLQLLNTLGEKVELLQETGIDHLVIVPFTHAFAEQPAEDYIRNFIVESFHPSAIIIGYDHRFGKDRAGDYRLLETREKAFGYQVVEISQHLLNEIEVSSTRIRNALLQSDVETANGLLGYPFFFEGEVVGGDRLGRTIGYPTANLQYTNEDKIRLGHGVYAVSADVAGRRLPGMMSIGTRPTLENSEEKVEVNLFDFNGDLYGKNMRVHVSHFLRHQEKYPSLHEMMQQLEKDEANSRRLLGVN